MTTDGGTLSRGFERFLKEAAPLLEIDWRKYRRKGARKRAAARLAELGLEDWDGLLERLRTDPEEARRFPDRMRVTVSRFFRERERWEVLMERVVPPLWADRERSFRAWSAGCASGEEPYTLALLWLERFGEEGAGRLDLLATDIDGAVLGRARAGVYDPGSVREVPPDLLPRRFERRGKGWRLKGRVREMVVFRRRDLMNDPPPEGMDLALCRYLAFTYYRGGRRNEAARRLWGALRPGGALMIGRKEGLGPMEEEFFEPWAGAPGVYRKAGAGCRQRGWAAAESVNDPGCPGSWSSEI